MGMAPGPPGRGHPTAGASPGGARCHPVKAAGRELAPALSLQHFGRVPAPLLLPPPKGCGQVGAVGSMGGVQEGIWGFGGGPGSPPRCRGRRCHPPWAPAPRPPAAWHACSRASAGAHSGLGGSGGPGSGGDEKPAPPWGRERREQPAGPEKEQELVRGRAESRRHRMGGPDVNSGGLTSPGGGDVTQEASEEDKQLQDELEMLVERLGEKDTSLYRPALEELRRQIRSSTTSMTSVPKPLKFLRPHYGKLKEIYESMAPGENKRFAADIISVLAMTMSGERECLKYRLVGSQEELASWGHEYVRHLAGEVAKEWQEIDEADKAQRDTLLTLVKEIVPYNMAHNAEHEACDLLMEIEQMDMLEKYIDDNAYSKVCLYLTSCVSYVPEPENSALLRCALGIFRKFSRYPEALRLALMLNDVELVEDIFTSCKDVVVQKQMAFMLGRHGVFLELNEDVEEYEDLTEIMSNVQLNSNFLALARELDIMEPKVPDDIYKTHLENNRKGLRRGLAWPWLWGVAGGPGAGRQHSGDLWGPLAPRFGGSGSQVDSARMNLASSFVNGFVNAAFGQDKLLTDDGNKWLYKNKDHGMLSAAASLGTILLWDVDGGLTQIDKYLYSSEDYIKSCGLRAAELAPAWRCSLGTILGGGWDPWGDAGHCLAASSMHWWLLRDGTSALQSGALLACGIVNSGVRNECDPALALLSDYVLHNSNTMRIGAIFGLGLAYAGSNREDVLTLLLPVMGDSKSSMEVAGVTALACGMISVGSCNGDVTSTILQTIMEKSETELKDTYARWLPLGLGLNHLGKGGQRRPPPGLRPGSSSTPQPRGSHPWCCPTGKGEAIEAILAALEVVSEPFRSFANTLVDICAYAGSGNVLKVQQLLHICSEHFDSKEKEEDKDKKDKKEKEKKESSADMGAHQVGGGAGAASGLFVGSELRESSSPLAAPLPASSWALGGAVGTWLWGWVLPALSTGVPAGRSGVGHRAHRHGRGNRRRDGPAHLRAPGEWQRGDNTGLGTVGRGLGKTEHVSVGLLRYGEPTLRRAVPLALALISVSNPRLNILDTLSKFSHDADPEVSYNSIFAMGMVGSGTNNARLAAMLRQLAQYHAKDPNNLFMVRLAQVTAPRGGEGAGWGYPCGVPEAGLTHLGKGTLTLCPYHSDRQLMSQVAVAGLLTVLVSFLDVRNIILGKSHYVLYGLVAAMQPRMLVTFDEELRPLPVSVRVGQAVDVVGQAGKPKTITGFQTHTTPVLLAHGERAELATEEHVPVTPILEGFVILRKNPNYDV
ncbi:26S proteasome non-ATPase regulatory subunit 2 [Aix galericulata]|nr:26S proteasome non-ATPase regulatory subunit 2 [Aix galericulata]